MSEAIILLGPPGAGKGTQAVRLAAALGVPHISTGQILRRAVAEDTALGRRAKEVMEAGRLVDDAIMLGIIEERLGEPDCAAGFILDGYPRNRAQGEALDRVLDRLGRAHRILALAVPREELEARIRGRRSVEGREDDSEKALRQRLAVHESESGPLLAHYGDRAESVSGVGAPEEIFERLRAVLSAPAPAGGSA